MSSINTNLSAMTALQNLKSTQSSLNKTQGQISTGLRVSEASHNASYWSIATQMKSDNGALGAVKDAIKQSKAMINTNTSAMDKTLTYLNKMKEGLVAASQPGADLTKIQTEFDAHIEGMKSAANSASFNGQNWLSGDAIEVDLVVSYDGQNNKVNKLTINTADTTLFKDSAAGTGGILGDVAAIDISAVAGTKTATATAHDPGTTTTTTTPTASGQVTFAVTDVDAANGARIEWTSAAGGPQTLDVTGFTGGEDGDDLVALIEAQDTSVDATWDATDGLTIASKTLTDDVTGQFTKSNGSGALGTATSTGTHVGPAATTTTTTTGASAGTAVFDAADVELAEGNTITWKVNGQEKSYTMQANETKATLATNIAAVTGAGVAAAWNGDSSKLTLTASDATHDVTATFRSGEVAKALESIDKAISDVTKGSAMLGANKNLLETQEEFISTLSDSLTAGVSAFVDADMNEASTRLQALQTQQQLGVQALSIANQNSQMILRLFQ